MRYGEIFELTGKGKLPGIRATLNHKAKLVHRELRSSENNDSYDDEGIANPPSEETRKLTRDYHHLVRRQRQAAHLASAEIQRDNDYETEAAKNLDLAKAIRRGDRIKSLDKTKPDDWLKLKILAMKGER